VRAIRSRRATWISKCNDPSRLRVRSMMKNRTTARVVERLAETAASYQEIRIARGDEDMINRGGGGCDIAGRTCRLNQRRIVVNETRSEHQITKTARPINEPAKIRCICLFIRIYPDIDKAHDTDDDRLIIRTADNKFRRDTPSRVSFSNRLTLEIIE